MTIKTSTLRPGLLISLRSSVTGNVSYERRELVHKKGKDGSDIASWTTIRVIADRVEYEAAHKTRSKARSTITSVCTNSAFGLMCPESDEGDLEAAISEARKIAEKFNETAKLSRVGVYVITGRIAADDVEAVRAINSEVRELLDDMKEGLKNLDVKRVRDAAAKAKAIGNMLSPDAALRIQSAVEAARKSATKMAKAGDQLSMEIDNRTIRTIAESRTAFLDIDVEKKEIAKPKASGRAVDLSPTKDQKQQKASGRKVEVD